MLKHYRWVLLGTLFPMVASANVGIPLLVIVEPILLVSLFFVIMIEAHVMRERLKSSLSEAMKAVIVSNLITTIIGVPIVWGLLVLMSFCLSCGLSSEVVVWLIPVWIPPYEDQRGIYLVAWGLIYTMVVFGCISAWIESKINRIFLKVYAPQDVTNATWRANLYSYGLLMGIGVVIMIEAYNNSRGPLVQGIIKFLNKEITWVFNLLFPVTRKFM